MEEETITKTTQATCHSTNKENIKDDIKNSKNITKTETNQLVLDKPLISSKSHDNCGSHRSLYNSNNESGISTKRARIVEIVGDPNFAVIVNFLNKFSAACGISIDKLNIEELASMLENSDEVTSTIEDIHTKLLRKIRKTVPSGKWENVLAKFAYTYSMQDAWELERFGYKKSSLSVKLRVLKALVESQFDRNVKFKSYINGIAAQELRAEPVGRDMLGNIYWCIMDKYSNIRIFRENPDDESWIVVASNRDEMVRLIEKLCSNDADIFSVKSPIDEDSCSTDASIYPEMKSNNLKSFDKATLDPSSLSYNVEKNNEKNNDVIDSDETIIQKKELNEKMLTECINTSNETDTTEKLPKEMSTSEKHVTPKSETQPIFSSVITEPVLIIQGHGNGEENNMGNIKNGDNSNATSTTEFSSQGKQLPDNISPKIDLPLKKKINKSYCENVEDSTTSNKNEDENINEIKQTKTSERRSSSDNSLKKSSKQEDNHEKESANAEETIIKSTSIQLASESVSKSPESTNEKTYAESSDQHKITLKTENSQTPTRGKRGRKTRSGIVDGLDISQVIIDNDSSPPVRQSRRIAQQKIKEETDRRMIEEKMLREMKKEAIRKKKRTGSQSEDEEYVLSDSENSKNTTESKTKKKKNDKPWLTSTSESSSETEPEEDYIEPDHYDGRRSPYKSDHEFSPESDLENECTVPTKRARTVKVEGHESDNESVDSNIDHSCQKCGKTDHPEWILLCDSCDKGYHCSCLTPVLFIIPEGDWFCPKCQHAKLIENLRKTLLQYDEICSQFELLKKQEEKEKHFKKESVENSDLNSNDSEQIKQDQMTVKIRKASSEENSNHPNSSTSDTDEDDIPIYKLRRRNQNSNYRFNDYDDLINSAINRGITDDNEPISSGKDIRNIIKANNKQEKARSLSKSRSRSSSPIIETCKTNKRKNIKKKKLNNLDYTSDEDDESDTDFKDAETSSETENSLTEESESSLELSLSRKSRKARKKYDMDFINDGDESDKSTYNMRKQRKKIQKILEDSDDFDEDEITESEEIDSADLCSDTETDSSRDKRKGKSKQINNAKSIVDKSATNNRKRKIKKTDDDKAYRSGIKKKTKVPELASSSSDDDKTLDNLGKRRTRGKKLHYILDEDFESSDDGITPGVHRPDTPPEERERFIKRQEEIKRMLAEKNTAAAKELATPKINSIGESIETCKTAPLSVVPMQIIESAKALDMEFLKSAKSIDSDEFDDELAVNFSDPGDVNEDDLAKIMEEEDFAQHQPKNDEEASVRKSTSDISPKKKVRDFDTIDPSAITKMDKKSASSVTIDKKIKVDCPSQAPVTEIENCNKPFLQNYVPNKPNEINSYLHQNYPCVPPLPPVVSTSILQQMKQQAIPLQAYKLQTIPLQTPSPALTESQYLPTTVPLSSSIPLMSNKISDSANPNISKEINDTRRRRRKKITPLRGDLYKAMDNQSLNKPLNHLHYHLPPNSATPEAVATVCSNNKQGGVCDPCSSTHVTDSFKIPEINLRYPQGVYPPSSNFPLSAQSATSVNTDSLASSSGLHESLSRPTFITLEPVNAEDQTVESPTIASENIRNVTVDAESSSEFSGLVSYFSSQQNELNA